MEETGRSKSQGILGFLFDELRNAFQDIRQKVIEEGWFGRVVTAAPVVEMDPAPSHERPSNFAPEHPVPFEELWATRERVNQPSNYAPEHDGGIDR